MEVGPLGQLLLDLRARIAGADENQRAVLAMKWARRGLHVHLTAALAHQGKSSPRLNGWLGAIESSDDRARALTAVENLLREIPETPTPLRTEQERDWLAARLALGLAKTILESLQTDLGPDEFRRLAWAVQMLAERAKSYEDEQRQMLADAGGPP